MTFVQKHTGRSKNTPDDPNSTEDGRWARAWACTGKSSFPTARLLRAANFLPNIRVRCGHRRRKRPPRAAIAVTSFPPHKHLCGSVSGISVTARGRSPYTITSAGLSFPTVSSGGGGTAAAAAASRGIAPSGYIWRGNMQRQRITRGRRGEEK